MSVQTVVPRFATNPLLERLLADNARFKVLCCGRRFGKTTLAVQEQLNTLKVYADARRAPTRGLFLAPTYKLVEEDWRALNAMVPNGWTSRNIADLAMAWQAGEAACETQMLSTESEGGVGRGGGFHHVVFDEASRIPERIWTEEIRPALSDTLGRALFISTPQGRNWFERLWHQARETPGWSAYHYTTMDGWRARFAQDPGRLALTEQEWDLLRATTPEKTFKEEYLAEFVEHEGAFLTVAKVLRGALRPALPGRHYVAGLDVARVEDWMVTLVMEVETRQVVALVRSRHRDWSLQKATAMACVRQYPSCRVLIDSTGVGDPIAQDLRSEGLDVEDIGFTAKRKQELVENLVVALEQGLIALPDQAETVWLLEELRSYEERESANGHITYSAPSGLHDDGVTALMLACWGVRYDLQRPVVALDALSDGNAFTFRQYREYEERLRQYQNRFPDLELPAHPHDLRLVLGGWR